jgi:hypothetical protein
MERESERERLTGEAKVMVLKIVITSRDHSGQGVDTKKLIKTFVKQELKVFKIQ